MEQAPSRTQKQLNDLLDNFVRVPMSAQCYSAHESQIQKQTLKR